MDAVNSGHVTAYGPGLSHGIVNEPAYFTIVTKDAGAGIKFQSFLFKAAIAEVSSLIFEGG